jgi:hypothetical protein
MTAAWVKYVSPAKKFSTGSNARHGNPPLVIMAAQPE